MSESLFDFKRLLYGAFFSWTQNEYRKSNREADDTMTYLAKDHGLRRPPLK